MAAEIFHLLAFEGLRIFWARHAVQMCIESDANLISTIVAKERTGGTHFADFKIMLRHVGLRPGLVRRGNNRD